MKANRIIATMGAYMAIHAGTNTVTRAFAGTGWTDMEGTQGESRIRKDKTAAPDEYKRVQFPSQTSIANAEVTLEQTSYTFDGKAKEPAVESVKLNDETLVAGTDFTVSYKDNTNVGTATVTVTGTGGYKDSATATFAIEKASIAKAKVTLKKKSVVYNGKAQKPGVKSVVLNGKKLKAGTDYKVS